MSADVSSSAGRLTVIAANTFRESVRQRFFVLPALAATAVGVAAWWLRDCSPIASREKFLFDAGIGALTFFGAVVAVVAVAESFLGEIERKTILAVLSRPVRRGEFVLGKLCGILVLLLAFCAAGTGFMDGLLRWEQTVSGGPLAEGAFVGTGHVTFFAVIACGLVQWLRCAVLAALTLFISSYVRGTLLAVMTGFAALVVCNLPSLAGEAVQASGAGWLKCAAGAIGYVVPDFNLYDVADGIAIGGTVSVGYLMGIALYSAAYVGLFASLAILCFRHREL